MSPYLRKHRKHTIYQLEQLTRASYRNRILIEICMSVLYDTNGYQLGTSS